MRPEAAHRLVAGHEGLGPLAPVLARAYGVGRLEAPVPLGDHAGYAPVHVEHDEHRQEEAAHRGEYHVGRVHVVGALLLGLDGVARPGKAAQQGRARDRPRQDPDGHDHETGQALASPTAAVDQGLRHRQVPVDRVTGLSGGLQ